MLRSFLRTIRNIWELGYCLDVVPDGDALALTPRGEVRFGTPGHPFASLTIDRDTLYVYALKDDANWERLTVTYNGQTNNFEIKSEAAGTGQLRKIKLGTAADEQAMIINADGTVDFPSLGVLRFDVPQLLSASQQSRLRSNLGI